MPAVRPASHHSAARGRPGVCPWFPSHRSSLVSKDVKELSAPLLPEAGWWARSRGQGEEWRRVGTPRARREDGSEDPRLAQCVSCPVTPAALLGVTARLQRCWEDRRGTRVGDGCHGDGPALLRPPDHTGLRPCRLGACVHLCFCPWETLQPGPGAQGAFTRSPLSSAGFRAAVFRICQLFSNQVFEARRGSKPCHQPRASVAQTVAGAGGPCCCCTAWGQPGTRLLMLPRARGAERAVGHDVPRSHLSAALGPDGLQGLLGARWGGDVSTKHPASPGAAHSPASWASLPR